MRAVVSILAIFAISATICLAQKPKPPAAQSSSVESTTGTVLSVKLGDKAKGTKPEIKIKLKSGETITWSGPVVMCDSMEPLPVFFGPKAAPMKAGDAMKVGRTASPAGKMDVVTVCKVK